MDSKFDIRSFSIKPKEYSRSSKKSNGGLLRTIDFVRYKDSNGEWVQVNYGIFSRRGEVVFSGDFDMEGTESYPHILVILKNTYFSEWDYRCLSDENLIDQKLKEIRRKKLDLFDLRDDVESFLQERDQSCEVFLQPQPRFTVPLLSHELNPDLILEKDLLDGLYEGRYLFI